MAVNPPAFLVLDMVHPDSGQGGRCCRDPPTARGRAVRVLAEMGLSVADYIRMALAGLARDTAVPRPGEDAERADHRGYGKDGARRGRRAAVESGLAARRMRAT